MSSQNNKILIKNLLNKITLGDCFEIMKQLPDKCIDLVLTDPPYGSGGGGILGKKEEKSFRGFV